MNPHFVTSAWVCGLCALVPLPWVDDWLERRFTRRLFEHIADERGVPLGEPALTVLTEDRSSIAVGCLTVALVWPLKKLFRTVFYFLTVKDVFDGVTRAAHRATLLDVALGEGLLPGRADLVRTAMDDVLDKLRYSPVTRPLWRQERPPVPWSPPERPGARFVHWLQRHGGGGLLVPMFKARLAREET